MVVGFTFAVLMGFNPRSRGGSDAMSNVSNINPPVSIHAPAEGATLLPLAPNSNRLFQSTLPRRERLCLYLAMHLMYCFNPRSRGGSDQITLVFRMGITVSIHAPAEGATAFRRGLK